ncbi:uncharacterized protein LOC115878685 [Sitophilus oryzae]|uniref:poly(ADP-ribose) glycohydrolase n=1 Tax=Sitophilus oryzae TaxID=7048 RepID=A0A6J2XI34_SITOR|nr:uncharacterized protein LOC115878685 [Sitophilus oryzae]
MALVMLPSDLPWWDSVKKCLKKILHPKNARDVAQSMQKIYEMCSVSLDPDEETVDPDQFVGFLDFIEQEMTEKERDNLLNHTLPNIAKRALSIKDLRPRNGFHFSLQQQADSTEIEYSFAASLLANAFFSTFPTRTQKSHPTLQNFNFANFFKSLKNNNAQQAKLRSILRYFDWLEEDDNIEGSYRVLRQVMSSKEWLTIDDWLECSLPLCPLQIKHEGRLDRADPENLQVCFCSSKIGGNVLGTGCTQESVTFTTIPELLVMLLNVEALEDNEVVTIDRARQITRIKDFKRKATVESLEESKQMQVCCMDAENYTKLPIGQYEEDNILRELNKSLLGFQQKQASLKDNQNTSNANSTTYSQRHRRLSPIGESISSNPSEGNSTNIPFITQQSCSTTRTDSLISQDSGINNNGSKPMYQLHVEPSIRKDKPCPESILNNRRGRFIVLGSSGECLPVTRNIQTRFSSSDSSEDDFHSAKSSLDDGSGDDNYHKRYSIDLETPELRHNFAQRLRDVLKTREVPEDSFSSSSSGEDSSYAVGISVTGSQLADCDIKVKRGGSTGFALREESLDEDFLQNSLNKERAWIDKFKNKQSSALSKKESNRSSDYSFSTDYSSELEEVYEQFNHWLENPIIETEKGTKKDLDGRDLAVVRFAGSLLKRTLSESFAGIPVPLTENCDSSSENRTNFTNSKHKLVLNAKSLSLELARQKHKLAAQLSLECGTRAQKTESSALLGQSSLTQTHNNRNKMWFVSCVTEAIIQTLEDINYTVYLPVEQSKVSDISEKPKNGTRAITTGNWGCGTSRKGDVQLKVVIQWMAASVAGAPSLIYYTYKHQQLAKLDTVCRILIDRKWTVKDLAEATLKYSNHVLRGKELSGTLFEELICAERNVSS